MLFLYISKHKMIPNFHCINNIKPKNLNSFDKYVPFLKNWMGTPSPPPVLMN